MNTSTWISKPIHLYHKSFIELEITQISLVVVEHLKKLGCLLGLSRCAKWTNDHTIVHLWAKTVPQNLRWGESIKRLWSYSMCNDLGTKQECMGGSDRPMTMLLHICWPRQCYRTWNGVNRSSGCRVTMSARIWVSDGIAQKHQTSKWPCYCTSMGQDGSI